MTMLSPLAKELNNILDQTSIGAHLSTMGRRLFFPKGIVAQSAEAKNQATRFNATVGMAYEKKILMTTKVLCSFLPSFTPSQIVSYAPTGGILELRKIWKTLQQEKNPSLATTPFLLPIVTTGITHGISIAADLFLDAEDDVILPDMRWGNYDLIFAHRHQANIKTFPLFTSDNSFNIDALKNELQSVKKAFLVLNFPNNPTGYSPTKTEAQSLLSILKEAAQSGTSLVVIFDDAYFGLFYEDVTIQESLFASVAQLHKNIIAIKVDGITKEDFSWGLRVGFITISSPELSEKHFEALEKKCFAAVRSTVSNVSHLSQELMIQVLNDKQYLEEKNVFFYTLHKRYQKIKELLPLMNSPILQALPFNSGYFMTFRCPQGYAEPLRQALLQKRIGIIAIQNSFIRVSFASIDSEDIETLLKEIAHTAQTVCNAS